MKREAIVALLCFPSPILCFHGLVVFFFPLFWCLPMESCARWTQDMNIFWVLMDMRSFERWVHKALCHLLYGAYDPCGLWSSHGLFWMLKAMVRLKARYQSALVASRGYILFLYRSSKPLKMTKWVKKVGITGKYGTRYGDSWHNQIEKMKVSRRSKCLREFWGRYAVKIKTVGIWDCKVCGKVKASKDVFEAAGGETPPPSPESWGTCFSKQTGAATTV